MKQQPFSIYCEKFPLGKSAGERNDRRHRVCGCVFVMGSLTIGTKILLSQQQRCHGH